MRKAHEISGPLLFPSSLMTAAGRSDEVAVFVGGTIPQQDQPELLALGVKRIFTAEMALADVIAAVAEVLK